jgi:hypothetical protein
VCATESLFVQVTAVPTATVSDTGLKAIPDIVTVLVPFPVLGEEEGLLEYILDDLLQLMSMQRANILIGIKIKTPFERFLIVFT